MKKLFIALTISFLFLSSYSQPYSGGTGTLDCPYQIATAADLEDLMDTQTDWDKYFVLIEDINCTSITNAKPIGRHPQSSSGTGVPFTGKFFGNNYTISNLKLLMGSTQHVGLFGYIAAGSEVTGVVIYGFEIEAIHSVGALCGNNYGYISNCKVQGGAVKGESRTGGLVGNNYSKIFSSSSNCVIEGTGKSSNYVRNVYVGGFVGYNEGTIMACNSYSEIWAPTSQFVGGFCGFNTDGGGILHCTSAGDLNCRQYGGGFCGHNGYVAGIPTATSQSIINDCHSSTLVCVEVSKAGGFVGENNSHGKIIFCSSSGNAILKPSQNPNYPIKKTAGGFVGEMWSGGKIDRCIASGRVSAENYVGGFVGIWHNGSITNCSAFGVVNSNVYATSSGTFYGECGSTNTHNSCSILDNLDHACLKNTTVNYPADTNCYNIHLRNMTNNTTQNNEIDPLKETEEDPSCRFNLIAGASTAFGLPENSSSIVPQFGFDFNFGKFGVRITEQFFKTSPEFDINGYLEPFGSNINQTGVKEKSSNFVLGINPYIHIPLKDNISLQPALGLKYLIQNGATNYVTYAPDSRISLLEYPDGDTRSSSFLIEPTIRAVFGKPTKTVRYFVEVGYSFAVSKNELTYKYRDLSGVYLPDGSIDPDLLGTAPVITGTQKIMPKSLWIGIGLELNITCKSPSGKYNQSAAEMGNPWNSSRSNRYHY